MTVNRSSVKINTKQCDPCWTCVWECQPVCVCVCKLLMHEKFVVCDECENTHYQQTVSCDSGDSVYLHASKFASQNNFEMRAFSAPSFTIYSTFLYFLAEWRTVVWCHVMSLCMHVICCGVIKAATVDSSQKYNLCQACVSRTNGCDVL